MTIMVWWEERCRNCQHGRVPCPYCGGKDSECNQCDGMFGDVWCPECDGTSNVERNLFFSELYVDRQIAGCPEGPRVATETMQVAIIDRDAIDAENRKNRQASELVEGKIRRFWIYVIIAVIALVILSGKIILYTGVPLAVLAVVAPISIFYWRGLKADAKKIPQQVECKYPWSCVRIRGHSVRSNNTISFAIECQDKAKQNEIMDALLSGRNCHIDAVRMAVTLG